MIPLPDERRRQPRIATMILCQIIVGDNPPELTRVCDLNDGGIKIATRHVLSIDDGIAVRLPGTSDWSHARVAWLGEGVAGLAFCQPVVLPGVAGEPELNETSITKGRLRECENGLL